MIDNVNQTKGFGSATCLDLANLFDSSFCQVSKAPDRGMKAVDNTTAEVQGELGIGAATRTVMTPSRVLWAQEVVSICGSSGGKFGAAIDCHGRLFTFGSGLLFLKSCYVILALARAAAGPNY